METFLIVWAFVGCAYWLWMAWAAWRIVRGVPRLIDQPPPLGEPWPSVALIVPACNEGETIRAAAETLLAIDYPDFELILIDDRSTDDTGRIIDALAEQDPRVEAVHVTALPAGWLGKVHALQRGCRMARGEWLLFTDADIHFAPDAIRRAIAYAEDRGLDHLAVTPDIWPATPLVDATIAMFLRTFCVGTRCWAVSDPRSKACIGVGAFNLVRRGALDQTPGFEWLRMEAADDMALGQLLKRGGFRSALVNGTGLIGLHWYYTVAQMARAAEKGYVSVGGGSPLRILLLGLLMLAFEWAPLLVLFAPLNDGLLWPGLAMWASAVFCAAALGRWAQQRVWPAMLFPLGAAVNLGLLWRAGWLGWRRGGIQWRGTFYSTKELLAGSRVRFP